MKTYAYVLTINNYTSEELQAIKVMAKAGLFLHMVIGSEGEQSKTPHLQMCLTFNANTPWKKVKALFPRAHIERLKYDYLLACKYCKKEDRYYEYGDFMSALLLIADSYRYSMDQKYNDVYRRPVSISINERERLLSTAKDFKDPEYMKVLAQYNACKRDQGLDL